MDRQKIKKIGVAAVIGAAVFALGFSVGYSYGVTYAVERGLKFINIEIKPEYINVIKAWLIGGT